MIGKVVAKDREFFSIVAKEEDFTATRASSCLLAPEIGDKVLLIGEPNGSLYILAVLERASSEAARLSSGGDLVLDAGEGRITVTANEGIDLLTPQDVRISSARLEARAGDASFTFGAARLIGKTVDSVLGRMTQRLKNSMRWVEGSEQVRAGQLDYEAEGMMHLHGENTVVTAAKIVKADGKQVHIG